MDILTSPVFQLPSESPLKLRDRICEMVSAAISRGALPANFMMPSCRELAAHLGVSRNTVFAAYSKLVDLGLLTVKDRSGFAVKPTTVSTIAASQATPRSTPRLVDFGQAAPSSLSRISHPRDWSSYPYPFIYNQTDPKLFPIDDWRECSRQALKRSTLTEWTGELVEGDSPQLIRQLRQRLLIYRGVVADDQEIMITLGAQNALAIIGLLFSRKRGAIAVEDPGFPDARNAFTVTGNRVVGVDVDDEGLIVENVPEHSKLIFVTPSHQFPTSVTMSLTRRKQLIEFANTHGQFILEDDYEAEMYGESSASPPLRSLDRNDRVIYIGSLSKTLSPGLRIGFLVANRDIIREARAIRMMLLRHPPTILQETTALFLSLGYYDKHLRNFVRHHGERWRQMKSAIERKLTAFKVNHSVGGTSFWIQGPESFDASNFADALKNDGIIIDKGETFFLRRVQKNFFRLGFAYVDTARIDRGVDLIAQAAAALPLWKSSPEEECGCPEPQATTS